MTAQVVVVVPALEALVRDAEATASVETLFARGNWAHRDWRSPSQALLRAFASNADAGWASTLRVARGLDTVAEEHWAVATPVQLGADLSGVSVREVQAQISPEQLGRFAAILRAGLAELAEVRVEQGICFLRLATHAMLSGSTPWEMLGRSIDVALPDSKPWQRAFDRLQIELGNADLPANAVWLWGSGTAPSPGKFDHLGGTDPLLEELRAIERVPMWEEDQPWGGSLLWRPWITCFGDFATICGRLHRALKRLQIIRCSIFFADGPALDCRPQHLLRIHRGRKAITNYAY